MPHHPGGRGVVIDVDHAVDVIASRNLLTQLCPFYIEVTGDNGPEVLREDVSRDKGLAMGDCADGKVYAWHVCKMIRTTDTGFASGTLILKYAKPPRKGSSGAVDYCSLKNGKGCRVKSGLMMYESKGAELLPFGQFMGRLALHLLAAAGALGFSLGIGMVGYSHYENMSWTDAYVNASMLLSGMGPIETHLSERGKIFAGTYALYSGLVFIIVAGIIVAPVLHRFLHYLHLASEKEREQS